MQGAENSPTFLSAVLPEALANLFQFDPEGSSSATVVEGFGSSSAVSQARFRCLMPISGFIAKLRGVPAQVPIDHYPALADQSVVAVGDIHGRADLLAELHALIDRYDAESGRPCQEIYLGDYIDRGPASAKVIDMLLARAARKPNSVHLSGNHEAMLLGALADDDMLVGWLEAGGSATLDSYGIPLPALVGDLKAERETIGYALPAAHRDFLRNLGMTHAVGPYFFVHAGIRPGIALKRQSEADLIWIREPFLSSRRDHGCIVVHGHTPQKEPELRQNRINIDTGAVFTNHLTGLLIDSRGATLLRAGRRTGPDG